MSKAAAGFTFFLLLVALGTGIAGYFVDKKAYEDACGVDPAGPTADREAVDKRKRTARILNIVALASIGLSIVVLAVAAFKKNGDAPKA